tara:strand:- start:3019 stop:5040 length:2022 start_codon:yes stop_codon:yes gene_type:complete
MIRNFWISVVLCVSFQAGAQNTVEQEQEFESVVVTAQYKKTTQEKAVHKIKVIDRKTIDAMAAITLKDVLVNQNNIRVAQDNVLGSSMSLQGMSGQNIKILIDGIPVIGRLNGNIDISQINLNTIDRIEIVEGPLSVNYGTDALAGTINLISKENKKNGFTSSLNSYYENIGQYNVDGSLSYKKGTSSVNWSLGRNFFDGWNAFDNFIDFPQSRLADSLRYKQWKPKEQYFSRLGFQIKKRNLNFSPYLSYFYEKITNRGMPRAPYNETAFDDEYNSWRIDGGFNLEYKFQDKSALNIQTAYNNYKRIKNTFVKDLTTLNQELSQTPGAQDTITFDLLMSRGTWNTNRSDLFYNFQVGYDLSFETASGRRIEGIGKEQMDLALFASAELKFFKELILRPALRMAYNSQYRAPLVPSINLKYNLKSWTFRTSYAKGFRAPSLKELYFDFVDVNHNIVGNQNLNAEFSDNFTADVSYNKKRDGMILNADIGVFYNNLDNLITLAISPDNPEKYTYVNIGEYSTFGNQFNAGLNYKGVSVNAGVSYIGRFNNLANDYDDVPSYNFSPECRFNMTYNNNRHSYSAAFFFKYNGKRNGFFIIEDEVSESLIEAYNQMDFNVTKKFVDNKIILTLGVKNILNVQDVVSTYGSGGVHSDNSGSISMNWGRSVFCGLKFKL